MLFIGTSGFSFPDWRGVVYPANIKQAQMLPYYENELGFNTLEVNYTYYRLPSASTMLRLGAKTSAGFRFVVKAYRGMTHEIWQEEGSLRDNRDTFAQFREGIGPLEESGKLQCLLFQFPPQFLPREENLDYLQACKERLEGTQLVIEFRNRGWAGEEALAFLRQNGLGYCVVDEPPLSRLMPFVPEATCETGYFRFHGRNRNWFRAPVAERYNYHYRDEELEEFIEPVKKITGLTLHTYAFFNNCHAGAAARNAKRFRQMLGMEEQEEEKGQKELGLDVQSE